MDSNLVLESAITYGIVYLVSIMSNGVIFITLKLADNSILFYILNFSTSVNCFSAI